MAKIVHIIQQISRGGGSRATIYLAKYSSLLDKHDHTILSLIPGDPDAIKIAQQAEVRVANGLNSSEIFSLLNSADIVQFSWWNNVNMQSLLKTPLVPMRSVGWFHVGGTASPQVVTPRLIDYFDCAVACSPYTYQASAFQSLSQADKDSRTGLVYGATDFARIEGIIQKPHSGFNVGYIGTIDFLKMHRNYVSMCAKANIAEAKFMFCGSGEGGKIIREEAHALGAGHQFEELGYVEDIRDMLEMIDVYGYPLCPETYAASEMNLQEVMYAGIPSVVFPYGGIKELIIHNQTGLIVHSEEEFAQALRYLYENPQERKRIGSNAHAYARDVFGSRNAAIEINKIYDRVLTLPKRQHVWGGTQEEIVSGRVRGSVTDIFAPHLSSGALLFVDSLGFQSLPFIESIFSPSDRGKLIADKKIINCSTVLRQSGIVPYKDALPDDAYLQYWAGLAYLGAGLYEEAILALCEASNKLQDWRIFFFIAHAARKHTQIDLAKQAEDIYARIRTPEHQSLIADVFPGWN